MSKKALFADLTKFKKKNILKSVSTKITHRDGSSITVKNLAVDEISNDEEKKNESPPLQSKLKGLCQLSYSYNDKLNKWQVRNDKHLRMIEFDEKRLSKIDCSQFSISTIINCNGYFEDILKWLQQHTPTIIVLINIDIQFFYMIIKEKWIQKMYQCTDSEMGRNIKLWNCCCFSSISIEGINSSLLYKINNKINNEIMERFYFIQIHIYLGIHPFVISFCNLNDNEKNKKQTEFHLMNIFNFLNQNQMEENMFICIGCNQIIKQINDNKFKECKFILNSQQNDEKENTNNNSISNLLKTSTLKISAIECFNRNQQNNEELIKQCNHNELSCDIFATCVYFEQ